MNHLLFLRIKLHVKFKNFSRVRQKELKKNQGDN